MPWKRRREYSYSFTISLNSALDGSVWLTTRPGRFTPGIEPVPILQEAGWASGPVWMGTENLTPTGIRSPTVQPEANSYTDWAIIAEILNKIL
jgi:hypothetical protein